MEVASEWRRRVASDLTDDVIIARVNFSKIIIFHFGA
jgi:hypothetical protein